MPAWTATGSALTAAATGSASGLGPAGTSGEVMVQSSGFGGGAAPTLTTRTVKGQDHSAAPHQNVDIDVTPRGMVGSGGGPPEAAEPALRGLQPGRLHRVARVDVDLVQ